MNIDCIELLKYAIYFKDKMADEEYNKKLEALQQYIPFLDHMITTLKDPKMKNREQQLTKMEALHAMITDKKRK